MMERLSGSGGYFMYDVRWKMMIKYVLIYSDFINRYKVVLSL